MPATAREGTGRAADTVRSAVADAAAALTAAHADALAALDALGGRVHADEQAAAHRRRTTRDHAVTVARNLAAQRVTEIRLGARDAAAALLGHDDDGPLRAASWVRLGELRLGGTAAGVNEDIVVPLVVPLVGRANLVLEGPAEHTTPIVRRAVLEAFRGTAAGGLDVVVHDPAMSGALAPFAGIRQAAPDALTVLSSREDLDRLLADLAADVQRTTEIMRGLSDDLLAFREREGAPVGRLRLVVLLDHPVGVDAETHRRITTLMRVGPAAGIVFLVATDRTRTPADTGGDTWWDDTAADALEPTVVVAAEREGPRLRMRSAPAWHVDVPTIPVPELVADADALAARIAGAAGPVVPFARVQPLDGEWSASSADGLTFAIGAEGTRTITITLGDEREQRHNVLVTGAVGQGKSNLLMVIVHSLAARYSPDELELHLLDFKEGVTLYPLAPTPGSPDFLPHARVLGLESDREFGLAVLEHLEAEFARRARLFRAHGDSIAAYRRAVPDARMPRIVVVVDEFHMLFDPADETADRAARTLEAIARRGRSYGVHLVLASQTIAGIAALLTRENGIFAQFPIRLALKNALSESYAALAPGNDAAARLRARGTAILNLDYGAPSANREVVVAAADHAVLGATRRTWWADLGTRAVPPRLFDGSRRWRPVDAIDGIRVLRRAVVRDRTTPAAVIGSPITVGTDPATVAFAHEPGRHLAVIGAGEDPRDAADPDAANVAVGVLQTAALSLAMQHPDGDAEFVAIDLLDDESRRRADQSGWSALMERLGFPVRVVGRNDLPGYLAELAATLPDRADEDAPRDTVYVIGFALDRAVGLDTPDLFANRPVDALRTVLSDGPSVAVHLLGWWTNVATWKSHIGLMNEGTIDAVLVLRLDRAAASDVLGPLVPWTVRDNRGLLVDSTQRPEPTVIVPASPLAPGDAAAFTSADWDPS